MTFTIVICPGAWPLVKFFDPLIRAFEERNHTAICKVRPSYPTYDVDSPPEVNPDSDYLRHSVLDPLLEEGKDVVVFAHSYGGVYGPSSLEGTNKKERHTKGLEGGVIGVILNACFIAPKGTTAMTAMGFTPDSLPQWIIHNESTGLVTFDKPSAKTLLFHNLAEEEAEKLADMLPGQPYECFSTAAHWDPYKDPNFQGKIGYIFTGADRILPLEAQKMYVLLGGIEKTRLLKDSSHSPHRERPDELAETVLDLVREILQEEKL